MWTWRWSLHTATNIFNQSITYNYTYEGRAKNCGSSSASAGGNDVAVYPSEILYPNGKYRVRFDTIGRTDFDWSWDTDCGNTRFERSLLSQIRVEHYTGSTWQQVRKYVFSYGLGSGYIFPNVIWNNTLSNRYTPTLISVQEYGSDNSTLPATTFTYGDAMHLTRADNGYKGRVEFDYAGWHADFGPGGRSRTVER